MSLYTDHVKNWINCTRCPLHKVRKRVVICRGSVPAEILLIGEAPGESEDVIGLPFVGPAGKLLDRIVSKAESDAGVEPTKCYTNIVACIPKLFVTWRKAVEPLPEEIDACWPRLDEFINIVSPKLIVAIGELAKRQARSLDWESRAKVISIAHPAWLLRQDISRRGLDIQRVIVQLGDALCQL